MKNQDRNGQPLVKFGLYYGYNKGLYELQDWDSTGMCWVKKVLSGRGVIVHKPKIRRMGIGWLRRAGQ